MSESSKKIRELTEAMCAERDVRIRNRIMAVMGVLKCHSTKTASDFADVDRRTVQLWVARFDEGGIGGLWDAPGRGRALRARYGRIRRLADRLASRNMLTPRKLRNWIRGKLYIQYSLCSVRRILRFLGFSSKRSTTRYASAADADAIKRWQTDAADMISGTKRRGFIIVVQDESIFLRTWDEREEAVVACRRSGGRHQVWQEGQNRRVRRPGRRRDQAHAAVRKIRRPDVRKIPRESAPQMG